MVSACNIACFPYPTYTTPCTIRHSSYTSHMLRSPPELKHRCRMWWYFTAHCLNTLDIGGYRRLLLCDHDFREQTVYNCISYTPHGRQPLKFSILCGWLYKKATALVLWTLDLAVRTFRPGADPGEGGLGGQDPPPPFAGPQNFKKGGKRCVHALKCDMF